MLTVETGDRVGSDVGAGGSRIQRVIEEQRKYFATGKTLDIEFRLSQLKSLARALDSYEAEILQAMKADLGKCDFDSYMEGLFMVKDEIKLFCKNLKSWTKPQKVKTPLTYFKANCYIHYEPYGVNLIIGAWNAPFAVTLLPLVGVIASGNCAVIKPSEYAPNCSRVMARIVESAFEKGHCTVVEGGIDVNKELLAEQFDFITYTGSSEVGKIVAAAAAKYLTPTILELGGKSPCIVDETADLTISAKRIMSAKCMNSGQICTSPDHLFVHRSVKKPLIEALKREVKNFYGDDPSRSPDYSRMINERHFDRVVDLLDEGTIVSGGRHNRSELYIEPTIITDVPPNGKIMGGEIFGPILPIIEYDNLDDVVRRINKGEKPLALYIYTKDKARARSVIDATSSGGAGINVSILHAFNMHLPFGGVGNSGIGEYRGRSSLESYSNRRGVMDKSLAVDPKMTYPPNKGKLEMMKKFF